MEAPKAQMIDIGEPFLCILLFLLVSGYNIILQSCRQQALAPSHTHPLSVLPFHICVSRTVSVDSPPGPSLFMLSFLDQYRDIHAFYL